MLEFSWITFQGKLTEDNRDSYGASVHEKAQCYVVADGSTGSPYGVETAQALTRRIIDCFDKDAEGFDENRAFECLKELQRDLKMSYTSGVASYVVAIIAGDKVKVIWAGDCCLGNFNDDFSILWKTPVHTLANALEPMTLEEISGNKDRHVLTRSFKCKRYVEPDYLEFSLNDFNKIVLATDGFWAGLSSEKQARVLREEENLDGLVQDDTSVLLIK